jgi:hypothetical protein
MKLNETIVAIEREPEVKQRMNARPREDGKQLRRYVDGSWRNLYFLHDEVGELPARPLAL